MHIFNPLVSFGIHIHIHLVYIFIIVSMIVILRDSRAIFFSTKNQFFTLNKVIKEGYRLIIIRQ